MQLVKAAPGHGAPAPQRGMVILPEEVGLVREFG
jgi:hypothetical protein